jgi:hypothetical protein
MNWQETHAMKIRSLIVGLSLIAPLAVLAQGDAMGGDKSLDQKPFFASLDANHDGKVTLAEWKAAGMPENVYSMIDAKKTGAATFADFEAHPPMTSFDANRDKKVTLEEMKAAIEKQMKAGGPGGSPGGPGGPGSGPGRSGSPGGPPPDGAPPGQTPASK